MGTASSLPNNEGIFYNKIISPKKAEEFIGINQKAKLITKIEWQFVWEAFLNSSFNSFQITLAEAKDVIREAAKIQKNFYFKYKKFDGDPTAIEPLSAEKDHSNQNEAIVATTQNNISLSSSEKKELEDEINDYFSIISDLNTSSYSSSSDTTLTQSVDILAVCSSMLFFSGDLLIEKKVEQLFKWIQLNPSQTDFYLSDFILSLNSFEKGISYCFLENAISFEGIEFLATQWFSLMTSSLTKGNLKENIYNIPVDKNVFFEFCTNRGYVVRKILENLGEIKINIDKNLILNEFVVKDSSIDSSNLLNEVEASGGDEWLANPAWKKTAEKLIPDQVLKKWKDTKPEGNLFLDWVHSYRGYDCRNNIYLLSEPDNASHFYTLFHAAGLVVVQRNENNPQDNISKQKQFFFNEHDDDVTSIAILPNYSTNSNSTTTLIASGEIGKTPSIYIYSFDHISCTFDIISVLSGFHTKGIAQLAFTPDGKYVFTISIEYAVAIYNIDPQSNKCGKMIASAQGPKGKILQMISIPVQETNSNSSSKAYYFLSTGEKNMVKWTFTPSSSSLTFANTNMSKHKNKIFLSLSPLNLNGDILATSSEGSLFVVHSNNSLSQIGGDDDSKFNPHKNFSLNAAWSCPEKNFVLTGDKSGRVAFWHYNGTLNFIFDFFVGNFNNTIISSQYIKNSYNPSPSSTQFSTAVKSGTPIRALYMCLNTSKLIIGTQNCEIYTIDIKNFNIIINNKLGPDQLLNCDFQILLRAHYQGEVWGLSPKINFNGDDSHLYATTGDDRTLRLWSLESHSQVGITTLPSQSRCCCFSPCGGYIAVGLGTGSAKGKLVKPEDRRVSIYRVEKKSTIEYNFLLIFDINDAKNWISVVKYSPDGSLLAVGSRDNNIYIYSVDNQYKLKYKLSKHSAGITHLDFSSCGRYLQSACLAYEILFFDLTKGTQITSFTGSSSSALTVENLSKHNSNTSSKGKALSTKTVATKGTTKTAAKPTSTSETSAVNLKDGVTWATWTLPIGWPVLGIWESSMDGSDINSVDRSPSSKFIATSDDFGTVKIFNYPALLPPPSPNPVKSSKDKPAIPSAMNNAYKGHSSHVTNVKWIPYASTSNSDYYLISVGGEDKGVFQWKMQVDSESTSKSNSTEVLNKQSSSSSESILDLLDEFPSGGDEFMAIKPWVGAIVKPTPWLTPNNAEKKSQYYEILNAYFKSHTEIYDSLLKNNFTIPPIMFNPNIYLDLKKTCNKLNSTIKEYGLSDPSPPAENELELEWVYGYRGYDVRNNIAYLHFPLGIDNQDFGGSNINASRCILYYTAAIAILLDPVNRTQRFYRRHDDDIIAMDVTTNFSYLKISNQVVNDQLIKHPYQHSHVGVALIATAQQGPGGKINVWLSSTLETISTLSTKQKNIVLVNFSTDGKYIISMSGGAGGDHSVVISDWKTQSVLSNTKVDACTVHTMCPIFNWFSPSVSTTVPSKGKKGNNVKAIDNSPSQISKNNFFVGGDKMLKLWSVDGRNPSSTKYTTSGGGKQNFKLQQFLSSVEIQGNIYIGSEDGSIYVIPVGGKNVVNSLSHSGKSGAITSLSSAYCRNPLSDVGKCYLLSGAKDGSIVIWDANVKLGEQVTKKLIQFNIKDVGVDDIISKQIMALSVHPYAFTNNVNSNDNTELLLLVGTRGCDLLEVKVNLKDSTYKIYTDDLKFLQQSVVGQQQTSSRPKSSNYPSNIQDEVKKFSPLTNPMCGIIQRGHCNDELWGLATHPFLPQFCTVGDDKTMRVYNLYEKRVISITPLGHMARAVSYHPTGDYVVVGFGGRVGRGKETGSGFVRIYSMIDEEELIDKTIGYIGNTTLLNAYKVLESQNSSTPSKPLKNNKDQPNSKSDWLNYIESNIESLPDEKALKPRKVLVERKDANQWISDVKFSSDGKTVVVGAHDCKIYIYDFVHGNKSCTLNLRSTFTKHNSVINHFDISADNRFLMSNCAAYELLFCDLKSGKQLTSATELRDVDWATITCTMMWGVQGIWDDNPSFDGSDINAVSRSNGGNLLAMGDDRGKVCLYRYPVIPNEVQSKDKDSLTRKLEYGGHSSHVMNVRWTVGDECLISVGGNDKCILQWRHKTISPNNDITPIDFPNNEEDVDIESKSDEEESSPSILDNEIINESLPSDDLLDLLPSGGDEVGCVKPWLGSIKEPSIPPKTSSKKPNVSISLSSVIGFNRPQSLGSIELKGIPSQYCTLSYTQGGTHIAYPVSTLGVLTPSILCGKQKSENNNPSPQRFLNGHDSIVLCMTVSPDGRFIATGQSVPNLAYVDNNKKSESSKDSKKGKGKGKICIWSATSINSNQEKDKIGSDHQLLCTIQGGSESFIGGVCMLKFNHAGDKLAVVSQDGDYTHSIWSDNGGCWSRVIEEASSKGDKQMPRFLQWLQTPHIVSGGGNILSKFSLEGGRLIRKTVRVSGNGITAGGYTCIGEYQLSNSPTSSWDIVVGTTSGDLIIPRDNGTILARKDAHTKGVTALNVTSPITTLSKYKLIISAGKDGFLKFWASESSSSTQSTSVSASLDLKIIVDISSASKSFNSFLIDPCAIYALATPPLIQIESKVLTVALGTLSGEVVELNVNLPSTISGNVPDNSKSSSSSAPVSSLMTSSTGASSVVAMKTLVSSHFKGELWGLVAHPLISNIFATVGDDSTLRIWKISPSDSDSAITNRDICQVIQVIKLPRASRCIDWHPSGQYISVGFVQNAVKNTKKKTTKKANEFDPLFETCGCALISLGSDLLLPMDKNNESIGYIPFALNPIPSNSKKIDPFPTVNQVKFDPSGNRIAVASNNSKIYGYNFTFPSDSDSSDLSSINISTNPVFIFDKHTSGVSYFDWSLDGIYIQSNDKGGELLFYNTVTKKQETPSRLADLNNCVTSLTVRNSIYDSLNSTKPVDMHVLTLKGGNNTGNLNPTQWATQTCIYGWPIQGIWSPNVYDGFSSVMAIDRSGDKSLNYLFKNDSIISESSDIIKDSNSLTSNSRILSTVTSGCTLKLFRYPCIDPVCTSINVQAHSSMITNVKWISSDHLVTISGDQSIYVWTVTRL